MLHLLCCTCTSSIIQNKTKLSYLLFNWPIKEIHKKGKNILQKSAIDKLQRFLNIVSITNSWNNFSFNQSPVPAGLKFLVPNWICFRKQSNNSPITSTRCARPLYNIQLLAPFDTQPKRVLHVTSIQIYIFQNYHRSNFGLGFLHKITVFLAYLFTFITF